MTWEERIALAQLRNSPRCLEWHGPNSPPKLPLPLRRSPPMSTPIPRLTPSPPQAASRCNQPFCCNTLFGPTNGPTYRQTERWERYNSIPRALTLYYVDRERRAKKAIMVIKLRPRSGAAPGESHSVYALFASPAQ